jgi:hypothetical protein
VPAVDGPHPLAAAGQRRVALRQIQAHALETGTKHGQRGEQVVLPVFDHGFALLLFKDI